LAQPTVDEQLAKWREILNTDVPSYDAAVKNQDVPAVILAKPSAGVD
jgi:hypothetical protein